MSSEDDGLVGRMSTGDPEALAELLRKHYSYLRTIVRRRASPLVKARESETDVVQSVCRELLNALGKCTFEGETAFRNWLSTAALRKIVEKDRYHRAAKRGGGRSPLPAGEEEDDVDQHVQAVVRSMTTAGAAAMRREEVDRVEKALDQLPEDYREVFILSHLMDLTHAEIGVLLGRTVDSVRNLLHRALARLVRVINAEGGKA